MLQRDPHPCPGLASLAPESDKPCSSRCRFDRRGVFLSCGGYTLRTVIRPLQIRGAPCKSATEGRKYKPVAGFQIVLPVVQTKRDGGRRRITVALDVLHHLVAAQAHSASRRIEDRKSTRLNSSHVAIS